MIYRSETNCYEDMAGKQRISTLQEDLQNIVTLSRCLICEKTIRKPVTTKCGHQFCQPCISRVIDEETGSAKCPSCRKSVSKESLVANAKITLMLDHINDLILAFQQELKLTVNTAPATPIPTLKQKQQNRTITPKAVKSTPKRVAHPAQKKVMAPSTPRDSSRPRRQSAVVADFALNLNPDSSSTENTPELPQSVPNCKTKVSTWLQDAATDVIPTQDLPVLLSSPATQSTLISVSQTKKKMQKRVPVYNNLQSNPISTSKVDKHKKDPFEYSQSDSLVKECPQPIPKRKLRGRSAGFVSTATSDVPQTINSSTKTRRKSALSKSAVSQNKKMESELKEQNEAHIMEMLLFQSQSEQYQNNQEQERLKEIESTNFMDPSEPRKRKRKSSMKPVVTTNAAEEEKFRKQIEEAETFDLVVENYTTKSSGSMSKNPIIKTPETKMLSSKVQRPSIVIETPSTLVTSKKVAFNVNAEEAEYISNIDLDKTQNKSNTTSPGFTRIKKLKTDFKSPKRPAMVPLDVSSTSMTSRPAEVSVEEIVPAEKQSDNLSMKIDSSSSIVKHGIQKMSGESFNSSSSSLGAPDYERVAMMENIVEQVEKGALNVSNLSATSETLGTDTQFSVTLIENSLPLENDGADELTISKEKPTQESKSDSDLIPCSIPSPVVLKDIQPSTQMSQTTVNLLEKLHDLSSSSLTPKRKTFSFESDTGDIMTEIQSRISTQEQLMNLTPVALLGKKIPIVQQVKENETEAPVAKFIKRGKFGQRDGGVAKFIQLGYLSPNLKYKRMKRNTPRWCFCGAWKSITNMSTHPQVPKQLETTGVQTCFNQMFTVSKCTQTRSLSSQDPFEEPKSTDQEIHNSLSHSNSAAILENCETVYDLIKECLQLPEKKKSSQKCKVDNSKNTEEEFDEELTLIERSQEVNAKKILTLRNKRENIESTSVLQNNDVAVEAMSDDEYTINSGDILQASISQPVKSLQIERSLLYSSPILHSSPNKLSTPLMSLNESDANEDGELICSKNKNRSRKRERSNIIYSDSDTDSAEKMVPIKKPLRLSIRKKTPKPAKHPCSSPTSSVRAIQDIVRADLEYARTVGPTLSTPVQSCNMSPVTVDIDSSPIITEMQLDDSQLKDMKKEVEAQIEKDTPSNALHDGTCGEFSENPFFDKELSFSPSQQSTIQISEHALAIKLQQLLPPKQVDQFLICVTPEKKDKSSNELKKNICKESDESESENLIEGTPKLERSIAIQVATPPPTLSEIQPRRLISVVYSSLDPVDAIYVDTFAKKFNNVKISNTFSLSTTHLVVPSTSDGTANTTYKFLLAVASGSWVVSLQWVKDCLKASCILPEDKYEMLDSDGYGGPKNSRLSPTRLFDRFEFICGDNDDFYLELSKDQLKTVLTYAGGSVLEPSQLQSPCKRKYRIIILPGQTVPKDLEKCCTAMLSIPWVIDSVEQFRLFPIVNLNIRPLEKELAIQADFPPEMLELPEEDSTCVTANSTVATSMTTVTQHSLSI